MISCKYGYVSPIEAKVFGELDRQLKQKKQSTHRSKDKEKVRVIKKINKS